MIKEIKFTDKAIKQINHLLTQKDKGSFFRIAIKGGGCSGFQYDFSFDNNEEDDDLKHENILIDIFITSENLSTDRYYNKLEKKKQFCQSCSGLEMVAVGFEPTRSPYQ